MHDDQARLGLQTCRIAGDTAVDKRLDIVKAFNSDNSSLRVCVHMC